MATLNVDATSRSLGLLPDAVLCAMELGLCALGAPRPRLGSRTLNRIVRLLEEIVCFFLRKRDIPCRLTRGTLRVDWGGRTYRFTL